MEEVLRSRTQTARQNLLRKRAEFDAIVGSLERGIDDSDGAMRIREAGSELSIARNALEQAVSEFNDYILRGLGPLSGGS